jgi:prevent-host-death family protein
MERIGVRELRQHASRYLARVAGGETLEVTDRGRAVAHLVPIRTDPWEDLLTSGRVSPAEDPADVADEAPGHYQAQASEALVAMRAEEG